MLKQLTREYSRSVRNKSSNYIAKHKAPKSEEQHQRSVNKHKPFVLGRDNVKRDFTPIPIPEASLAQTAAEREWTINRTRFGTLPVYTEYKNGRSRISTIIRRVEGSRLALKRDLEVALGKDAEVEVKETTGHLHIKGNQQRGIRYWLNSIGC